MSRFRHVAPAGTPVDARTLARWLRRLIARDDAVEGIANDVTARFETTSCVPVATGRAALTLVLKALARLAPPSRVEVVIPSYTCYTVAASVMCAGLRPRVVDIDPETLDFDRSRLEGCDLSRVLAIVPTNLYGLPSDLPYLARFSAAHGVRLVDDAAQSMGATVGGRASGTWGDAGIYSLDKGKCITAIEGGLATTRDPEVAEAFRQEAASLTRPHPTGVARDIVKLIAYAALLRPWLYWIPNAVPQLQLGTTRYTPTIALERYNAPLAAMGRVMLDRLATLNAGRRATAEAILGAIAGVPLRTVRVTAGAQPVYSRLPLLAASAGDRDALIARLVAHGIGATGSYPASVVDIPELREVMEPFRATSPVGRAIAGRVLTLPTHAFVSRGDIDTMVQTLRAHSGHPAA